MRKIYINKKVVALSLVALMLSIIIPITYAFFTSSITGNSEASSNVVQSGTLRLNLTDGSVIGTTTNWLPGASITKNFTVENIGTLDAHYSIFLMDVLNEFVDKSDLVYEISGTTNGSNSAYSTTSQVQAPDSNAKIINNILIAPGEIHSYSLTLRFLNKVELQDDNQNKSFSAKVGLYESGSEPYIVGPLNTYLRSLAVSNTIVQDDLSPDQNMRYIGADPANYIYFNCTTTNPSEMSSSTCETWRVIGVFNNGSYTGTDAELVKIVRNRYIEGTTGLVWDYTSSGSYTNNWNISQLQTFLNSSDGYYGGGSSYNYYNNSTTPTTLDISSYSIKSQQRNMIKTLNWKTGANAWGDFRPDVIYSNERGNAVSGASGSTNIWSNGKVGLPYMSDFAYATSGGSSTRESCLGSVMFENPVSVNWRTDVSDIDNCAINSWLINIAIIQNKYAWSLIGLTQNSIGAFGIVPDYIYGAGSAADSNHTEGVLPTLYLKENVKCINCGDFNVGTSSNPFKLLYSE